VANVSTAEARVNANPGQADYGGNQRGLLDGVGRSFWLERLAPG